jgi:purine-binding chemotaxis protein CheW
MNGDRYLCFSLGSEEFAIPLLCVKEVIAVPDVTPVPFTPPHFLGIMNLRGQVISVLDLRQKFGIKGTNSNETAVIICEISPLCIGVVVDSINSVIAPSKDDISDKPDIQSDRSTEYILGVYRKEKRLVLFLDISKTLSVEDKKAAQASTKQLPKAA